MIISTFQVAELFGVTERAVRKWGSRGCPRAGHGKWDLREVLNWWLENIYQAGEDNEAAQQAKTEYWQAKARVEKVKADVAEQSVVKIETFKKAWAWRVAEISNGLGGLPMRLAPLVANKSELEVRGIIEQEVWQIRDKFSRTGKFTPAPEKKTKKNPEKKKK